MTLVRSALSFLRRIPPLVALLAGTAVLYLWGLSVSGWANPYYAAAAQAGATSWRAMFFGAFDPAGSITVDKPPLALWPMALSVRLFGLSSWSILVPQALFGVATVAVLHAGLRRATGSAGAALLGGVVLALTPVAVLMFRFNNPDALLVLLLVGAAVATLRAVDDDRPVRWLVLAGTLLGLAFLTKMLQAFLVLPALVVAYLWFARRPWRTRLAHVGAAAAATLVAGSWWILAVTLWPAADRPFIGGSQRNSVLELVLGYNGVGRLTGVQTGAVSGPSGWGQTSLWRLLDAGTGGQIAWLIPAAVVLGVLGWRRLRTEDSLAARRGRAALVLWGLWGLTTFLTFSLMGGIFHDYYTIALAPAVASLVAIGAHAVWQVRDTAAGRRGLLGALGATLAMAVVVLVPQRGWAPWAGALLAAVVLLGAVAAWRVVRARRHAVPIGIGFASAALATGLMGPAAYSVATVAEPHTGAVPHAGPERPGPRAYGIPVTEQHPSVGDLLNSSVSSPRLTALLTRDADRFTWVAAVTGANSAAGFQLATGHSVMPLGGFNGTDPTPTLARFRALVQEQRVHWFLAGGGELVDGEDGEQIEELTRTGSADSEQIERWVARHFRPLVVQGITLYDLTRTPRATRAAPAALSLRPGTGSTAR
ncbi:glycosyltransferase family 39 protein [Nocardioides sp.]|uniref:glycosyltransferase family 39 protein n=1 Tax=Nocardioides sp. TaxID=35761 RepID=UPI003515744C